jgi:hypothetical protein
MIPNKFLDGLGAILLHEITRPVRNTCNGTQLSFLYMEKNSWYHICCSKLFYLY